MSQEFNYEYCYQQVINDISDSKYKYSDSEIYHLATLLYNSIQSIPPQNIICYNGECSPKINVEDLKHPILKRQITTDSHITTIKTKCRKCNNECEYIVFY